MGKSPCPYRLDGLPCDIGPLGRFIWNLTHLTFYEHATFHMVSNMIWSSRKQHQAMEAEFVRRMSAELRFQQPVELGEK